MARSVACLFATDPHLLTQDFFLDFTTASRELPLDPVVVNMIPVSYSQAYHDFVTTTLDASFFSCGGGGGGADWLGLGSTLTLPHPHPMIIGF